MDATFQKQEENGEGIDEPFDGTTYKTYTSCQKM